MKVEARLAGLFFLGMITLVQAQTSDKQSSKCPAVNCDCYSLAAGKWQDLCLARENIIFDECVRNSGVPQNYCGLHGPAGEPVATSIQTKDKPNVDVSQDLSSLEKTISATAWSLKADVKTFQEKEASADYSGASQVFSAYKREAEKLFVFQQKLVIGYQAIEKRRAASKSAKKFAKAELKQAVDLEQYVDGLWLKFDKAEVEQEKKSLKKLAFKLARESATGYERSADLYALYGNYQKSASSWQRASVLTKKIMKWEMATSNNSKYVNYYRAQVSARLNKATFYWLKADKLEKAALTLNSNKDAMMDVEKDVLAGDHEPVDVRESSETASVTSEE